MVLLGKRRTYMEYWHFSPEEKGTLIRKLTTALPALRGAVKATQKEVANAVGISRQTYCAVEMQKREMSWSTYMALILFFDYNPNSQNAIRQLGAFPKQLDECRLSGELTDDQCPAKGKGEA